MIQNLEEKLENAKNKEENPDFPGKKPGSDRLTGATQDNAGPNNVLYDAKQDDGKTLIKNLPEIQTQ